MIKAVINADDFAYSKVFNVKILDLLSRDAIKSTTVLIDRVDASQSYQVDALIGLHDVLGIGVGVEYELMSEETAAKDIESQYKRFHALFGFYPSHFNMHLPKVLRDKPDSAEITKRLAHEILKFAKMKNKPFNNDVEYGIENWDDVKTTTQPLFVGTYRSIDEIKKYFDLIS